MYKHMEAFVINAMAPNNISKLIKECSIMTNSQNIVLSLTSGKSTLTQ